jgi:hypothetical protein
MEGSVLDGDEPRYDVPSIHDEVAQENHHDGRIAPNDQEWQGIEYTVDQASCESFDTFGFFVDRHPVVLKNVVSDEV